MLTNPAALSEWDNSKDSTAGFMCTPDEHSGVPYNSLTFLNLVTEQVDLLPSCHTPCCSVHSYNF